VQLSHEHLQETTATNNNSSSSSSNNNASKQTENDLKEAQAKQVGCVVGDDGAAVFIEEPRQTAAEKALESAQAQLSNLHATHELLVAQNAKLNAVRAQFARRAT
jgi:hypothetical protein